VQWWFFLKHALIELDADVRKGRGKPHADKRESKNLQTSFLDDSFALLLQSAYTSYFWCSTMDPSCMELKICLLVYKAPHAAAPRYLRNNCMAVHSSASGLRLLNDKRNLHVGRTRTRFCVPRSWNRFPSVLCEANSSDCFKTGLKSYLFCNAYAIVSWL